MPDFWQFPTVSMGIGPINAIYQARFNRYLQNRGIKDTSQQHVWAFLGDGECDEPESLGAISLASREKLDNLIFVINCNLQRLDGPVRGNGKIVQELEGVFRGAGWNVIKLIWGSDWDGLFARDVTGALTRAFANTVDGQMQTFAAKDGLIGHAGIVVFDDSADMLAQARFAFEFCAIESCGKCTPCRIGSTRGVEVIDKITSNQNRPEQVQLLRDLCDTLQYGSLCAMGGMTAYPVASALKYFPADFGLTTTEAAQ